MQGGIYSELRGRTALISGGSRGIGAAIAARFASTGIRVVIGFREEEERAWDVVRGLEGEGHGAIRADVSHPDEVKRLVESAAEKLGRLDVLVNNAGVFENHSFRMESYEAWQEIWRRALDTNLMSAANAAFCAIPRMAAQGGGKIINVASRAGFRGEPEAPGYGASKAGMINLTRSLARALAGSKILAYCIAPGWVETAMARNDMETALPQILADIPLGRVASVDDVAGTALFLASDSANYLTGATIDVNGGSYFH